MTLDKLIKELQELQLAHGELNVYAVQSASGAADGVNCAFLRGPEDVGYAGPFDEDGAWIELSTGH